MMEEQDFDTREKARMLTLSGLMTTWRASRECESHHEVRATCLFKLFCPLDSLPVHQVC